MISKNVQYLCIGMVAGGLIAFLAMVIQITN
jgi:hypothetical protein